MMELKEKYKPRGYCGGRLSGRLLKYYMTRLGYVILIVGIIYQSVWPKLKKELGY